MQPVVWVKCIHAAPAGAEDGCAEESVTALHLTSFAPAGATSFAEIVSHGLRSPVPGATFTRGYIPAPRWGEIIAVV